MKKIFGILILLSAVTFCQQGNWRFLSPVPDGETNLSINAAGGKLYICGLFGKVIVSSDNGTTWKRQDWLTVRNLFEVQFKDENDGIIVGGNGDIFKTSNGGENWVRKVPAENIKLKDVEYFNGNVIVAVGEGDYICRSTDGGETWGAIKSAGKPGLWGLCYDRQTKTGLACGFGGSGGVILRTTDEGQNWRTVSGSEDTIAFYDINYISSDTAIAVGGSGEYQVIKKTTDGGLTWRKIDISPIYLGYYSYFESVKFADSKNGVIAGHSGTILNTTDGGETWKLYSGFGEYEFEDVEFSDSKTGYITGSCGVILKTTDAGITWKKITQRNLLSLMNINFCTPNDGVATGALGSALITSDGGKNWVEKPANTSFPLIFSKMLDPKHIIACGWRPDTYRKGIVTLTTDGGDSWKDVSPPNDKFCPRSIDFFDSQNGILVGFTYNGDFIDNLTGNVYKTSDGGATWQKLDDIVDIERRFPPLALKAVSSKTAILMGEYGTFFKTTDMGVTWQALSKLEYRSTAWSMDFKDEMSGFVSTMNGIFKTTDGGKTWKLLYDAAKAMNTVRCVHFCDKNIGYAVGEGTTSPNYALIMKTTDGGENWDFEFPPTVNSLWGVYAFSDTLAFIAGNGGTILTNGTPGLISDVRNEEAETLKGYNLTQNFPNPFNPETVINFTLPARANVTLKVYDMLGKEAAVLLNGQTEAGSHSIKFRPAGLASGIYLYRLSAEGVNITRKMLYLR
jgi:photosystem II stability/assembly factor-like uncharacterized protein